MQRPLTAAGLVAMGGLLGAGFVYAGRLIERHDARERAPAPAASAAHAATPAEPVPVHVAPRAGGTGAVPLVPSTAARNDDPKALLAEARNAYDRALKAALTQPAYDTDELVLLKLVAAGAHDAELTRRFSAENLRTKDDEFARLLDPGAKAPRLSPKMERGLLGLHQAMLASVGEPDERALDVLTSFAARTEQGYALSHQILALGWYEATGRRLTDELLTRRGELLEQLAKEQQADTRASDLFAERASTLLLYGAPTRAETRRWVSVLSAAQLPDGTWPVEQRTLAFDGESAKLEQDTMHTVAHALFVLRRFLDTSAVSR